jgi:hypothetical protein
VNFYHKVNFKCFFDVVSSVKCLNCLLVPDKCVFFLDSESWRVSCKVLPRAGQTISVIFLFNYFEVTFVPEALSQQFVMDLGEFFVLFLEIDDFLFKQVYLIFAELYHVVFLFELFFDRFEFYFIRCRHCVSLGVGFLFPGFGLIHLLSDNSLFLQQLLYDVLELLLNHGYVLTHSLIS